MNPPFQSSKFNWLILAGSISAALLPFAALWVMRSGLTYPCPFKFWVGIPCPTCGSTRSLAALGSLNVFEAFRFNPLLIAGTVPAVAAFSLRDRFPLIRRYGLQAFLCAIVLNWMYLIIFLPR